MFKIHYEHKGGYFCFQVPYLWLFWQKVQIESEDGTGLIILKFKSYADAKAHADSIGLTTLYKDSSANKYQQFVHGINMVTSGTPL